MLAILAHSVLLIALVIGMVPVVFVTPAVAAEGAVATEAPALDDKAGRSGEWGFRPRQAETCRVTPPSFVWRPQKGAAGYVVQCARDKAFGKQCYQAKDVTFNCHCPPKVLAPGKWYWRFRFVDKSGRQSRWSNARCFSITADALRYPMPVRDELLARIPKTHPRLFVRPEEIEKLRKLAKGDLKSAYAGLVSTCERLLEKPPSTEEPPKYPKGTVSHDETWRKIWWGNRVRTRNVLANAATLGFTRMLGGKDEYGQLAKRLLLAAADWDPKGATGYRYNDEAGMPYAYYFARTYTFVNDLLTDAEKKRCRGVMRIRGTEMYRHLCPRHLWRPYASHSNRAWHFLGEVGIAFLDEIPEARDWVWFATNVYFNVYPAWCDDDGGWSEGSAYWSSYVSRFTWWADVMRSAMGIDAYEKPYFSKVGYYAMYLQPPGTVGGGFGDQTGRRRSSHNRSLMTTLAAQSGNRYWQWYVDAHGGSAPAGGYVGFIRGNLPKVQAKPPTDLPSSRCFRGIGQAMLNSNLLDAKKNVQVIFKSSPFGLQSHGYESNNSFLLYAFGERLLIRSGRRDIHGSKHHYQWMHDTRSTNCITVDGQSQVKHRASTKGRITTFHTSDLFDYVCGDAGGSYGERVNEFERRILFVKPDLVIVFDRLATPKPSTFDYHLHALNEMVVDDQNSITVRGDQANCLVSLVAPRDLRITQTNRFDPPPRPRVKLVQWHLTARTATPAKRCEFVALLRPYRSRGVPAERAVVEETRYGYRLKAPVAGGHVLVDLRAGGRDGTPMPGGKADSAVVAIRTDGSGKRIGMFGGE